MNLLANGGFEVDTTGWVAAGGGGASAIARSATQAQSGSYSCKLTTAALYGHALYHVADVLTPGVTYTVSAWFYRTEAVADLKIEARHDDNLGDWAEATIPKVVGWSRVEMVGTVQAGDADLRLRVALTYDALDVTVYFDSVLVEELPSPTRSLLI